MERRLFRYFIFPMLKSNRKSVHTQKLSTARKIVNFNVINKLFVPTSTLPRNVFCLRSDCRFDFNIAKVKWKIKETSGKIFVFQMRIRKMLTSLQEIANSNGEYIMQVSWGTSTRFSTVAYLREPSNHRSDSNLG